MKMSNLIFIGTLHGGLTPEQELIKIVEGFQPSILLVEINQEDVENKNTKEYPEEMQAILQWGEHRQIEIHGFDSNIDPLQKNISESDLKRLDEEQQEILDEHNWEEFNKETKSEALKTTSWHKVINLRRWDEREQEMYQNIVRITSDSAGIIVVVTGSGHLSFFKSKFSSAQFPLS
jgi:uncharacterized protein (UPF0335 family)